MLCLCVWSLARHQSCHTWFSCRLNVFVFLKFPFNASLPHCQFIVRMSPWLSWLPVLSWGFKGLLLSLCGFFNWEWLTVFLSLLHCHADEHHLGGEHLHQFGAIVLLLSAHPSDIYGIVVSPFSSLRRSIKICVHLYLIGSVAPLLAIVATVTDLCFSNQDQESNAACEPFMWFCVAPPLGINIFSCGWSFGHLTRGLRSDFRGYKELMKPKCEQKGHLKQKTLISLYWLSCLMDHQGLLSPAHITGTSWQGNASFFQSSYKVMF